MINPYAAARRRAEDLALAAAKPNALTDLMGRSHQAAFPSGSMADKNARARGSEFERGFLPSEVERVVAAFALYHTQAERAAAAAAVLWQERAALDELGHALRLVLQSLQIAPAIGAVDHEMLLQPLNGLPYDARRLPAAVRAAEARVYGCSLEALRKGAQEWDGFMTRERARTEAEALEPAIGVNGLPAKT